jgi:hypothetical protein
MSSTTNHTAARKPGPSFWSDAGSPRATNEFGNYGVVFDRSLRSTVYLAALSLSVLLVFGLDWPVFATRPLAGIAMGVIVPLALAAAAWFSAPRAAGEKSGPPSWGGRAIGVLPGLFSAVIATAVMVKG